MSKPLTCVLGRHSSLPGWQPMDKRESLMCTILSEGIKNFANDFGSWVHDAGM
jgi:hypothetical protein